MYASYNFCFTFTVKSYNIIVLYSTGGKGHQQSAGHKFACYIFMNFSTLFVVGKTTITF